MRRQLLFFLTFFAIGALYAALGPNVSLTLRSSESRKASAADAQSMELADARSCGVDPSSASARKPADPPLERVESANAGSNADASSNSSSERSFARADVVCERSRAARRPRFFTRFSNNALCERSDVPMELDAFPIASAPNARETAGGAAVCSKWARFPVGSWARTRTTSVSYENGRPVQSVTETRATLKSVDLEARRYAIQYDSTIKLGVVEYPRKSKTVEYDFWDAPVGDSVEEERLDPVNLAIGSKTIPCQTVKIVRTTDQFKETTTLWYSDVVAPYLMQRKTIREPLAERGEKERAVDYELFVAQRTAANSDRAFAPANFIGRSSMVSGSRRQATTTVYSAAVPGAILRETTNETTQNDGTALFQTNSVLLDYYVAQ